MPTMSKMIKAATLASVVVVGDALTFAGHNTKADLVQANEAAANPIRKVVTLLQKMAKKVDEEGKAEADLYEKYECYCKTTKTQLEDEITRLTGPSMVTQPEIDALESELATNLADSETLNTDRKNAENSLEEAIAQRKQQNAEFKERAEAEKATSEAAGEAAAILMRGKGGKALLQSKAKTSLPILKKALSSVSDDARAQVLALLSGGESNGSPDLAVGTLNNVKDTADKAYLELQKAEDRSMAQFLKIKSSKADEVSTLLDQIQRKASRAAELRVQIVDKKHELKNGAQTLAANRQMLAEVSGGCDEKAKVWSERQKTRADEQTQLAEAIKVLNSDEALDQFKKTLGGPASLIATSKEVEKALEVVNQLRANAKADVAPELNFIALALSGKKVNFDKVNKMIDDMISLMKKQADEDENKKEYCQDSFAATDRSQKTLTRDIGDIKASIKDKKANVEQLESQIKALQDGIASLDKTTKQAADDRAKETAQTKQLVAENNLAMELLSKATHVLNKFYNPQQYVAATTKSPYDPYALVQVEGSLKIQQPPKTFGDTYVGNKDSFPVLGMLQTLKSDLQQEIKVAQGEEAMSEKEFQRAMASAATKRTADQDSVNSKNQAKADFEEAVAGERNTQEAKEQELKASEEVVRNLHNECDWLLKNYDLRRSARKEEAESLKRAKATLAGADLSL